MERFRPIEPCQKPIILNRFEARLIAETLRRGVLTEEAMDNLDLQASLLGIASPNDGPTTSIKNGIHGIRDTIQTLWTAPIALVTPSEDEVKKPTYKFVLPEKGTGEAQVEETLTLEEKSDRAEQALIQGILGNLSLISSAAEEIIRSSHSTDWDPTDYAEKIKKIVGTLGSNGMINRFDEFTRK